MCYLSAGDLIKGQEYFLKALFGLPALRSIILERKVPERNDRWFRGFIPDFESLWFDYEMIVIKQPWIESMYKRMLYDKRIVLTEFHSARNFKACREEASNSGYTPFLEKVDAYDNSLAAQMVRDYGAEWVPE